MSSSSSSNSRRAKRKPKQRNNIQKNKSIVPSVSVRNTLMDNVNNKVANHIRKYVQIAPCISANLTVGAGMSKVSNATGSAVSIFASSATADAMATLYFTLADLVQSTSFTALYDQYRITDIVTTFIINNVNAVSYNVATAGTIATSALFYAVDLDDATVVTPLTSLMEYENVQCEPLALGKAFSVHFKPHVALAAYSGTFTSYANAGSHWLDCGSPAIQHYGLKFGLPSPNNISNTPSLITIYNTYTVEFKGVR